MEKLIEIAKDKIYSLNQKVGFIQSDFWQSFLEGVKNAIAVEKAISESEITFLIDEVNLDDHDFIEPNYGITLVTSLEFAAKLIAEGKFILKGNFVIDVEGVVQYPLPDPDLEFNFEFQTVLNPNRDKPSVDYSLTIDFIGIQKPGLGWVFGVLGFLVGGPMGLAAGLGVGEVIDISYTSDDNRSKVVRTLSSIYETDIEILDGLIIHISRPTETMTKISMNALHKPAVFNALVGKSPIPQPTQVKKKPNTSWINPVLHMMHTTKY